MTSQASSTIEIFYCELGSRKQQCLDCISVRGYLLLPEQKRMCFRAEMVWRDYFYSDDGQWWEDFAYARSQEVPFAVHMRVREAILDWAHEAIGNKFFFNKDSVAQDGWREADPEDNCEGDDFIYLDSEVTLEVGIVPPAGEKTLSIPGNQ
jgi:hypothetical protein